MAVMPSIPRIILLGGLFSNEWPKHVYITNNKNIEGTQVSMIIQEQFQRTWPTFTFTGIIVPSLNPIHTFDFFPHSAYDVSPFGASPALSPAPASSNLILVISLMKLLPQNAALYLLTYLNSFL